MQRFSTTLRLARASAGLLRHDPALLVLPVLSGATMAAVALACLVPAWAIAGPGHERVAILAGVLAAVAPVAAVGAFIRYTFAVVVCQRLEGTPISVWHGLALAWERRGAIAYWALIAAAVMLVLRLLRQLPLLGSLTGAVAGWLLGAAWGAATFFVVPLIALEGRDAREALGRSATLFRERWGMEVGGVVSIALLVFAGWLVAAFALGAILVAVHPGATAVAGLAAVTALLFGASLVAGSALQQVFSVALFRYATGRPLPPSFVAADLQQAVRPRRRRGASKL